MNNVYLIIIVTLLFTFASTYSRMVYLHFKNKKEVSKLIVNIIVLEEYIRSLEDKQMQSDESVHKENFIKFLSDSRDWAYEYIEDVQEGLKVFVDQVEPELMYFDAYGSAGPSGPNYDALKQISAAFITLKELLPKEV